MKPRHLPTWICAAWLATGVSLVVATSVLASEWQSFGGLRRVSVQNAPPDFEAVLARAKLLRNVLVCLSISGVLFGVVSCVLAYRYGKRAMLLGLTVPVFVFLAIVEVA